MTARDNTSEVLESYSKLLSNPSKNYYNDINYANLTPN